MKSKKSIVTVYGMQISDAFGSHLRIWRHRSL